MGFSLRAALRLIFSKKKKTFINFLSYISILALSIGTASMIIILSVYNGLENTLKSIYQDFDAEIKVEKNDSKYFNNTYLEMISEIENIKEVSAIIENKVILQNEKKEVVSYLKGVDENYIGLNSVSKNLTEGEFIFKKNNIDYCVIGRGIKYSLGIRTNSNFQSIKVYSLNDRKKLSPSSIQKNIYNQDLLKTSGVFAIESGFDNNYIFTSLDFAQNLFDKNGLISSYEIIVNNKEKLSQTKSEIKKTLGPNFKVLTDIEQREGLYKILQTEKLVVYLVFLIVLFLSAINIFFLLIMMGIEKRKDISVMFSFGVKRHQIRNIFINQGIIIGLSSLIIGSMLGVSLTLLQQQFGLIQIEMTSSILTAYPVSLQSRDLLTISAMVIFVSLLASLVPGIISTKRDNFNNIKNSFI